MAEERSSDRLAVMLRLPVWLIAQVKRYRHAREIETLREAVERLLIRGLEAEGFEKREER